MEHSKPRINVIGSLNMDIVVETSRLPEQGETLLGEKVHFIPGGKGANQAVAAARLGAETRMIGAVGKDEFGKSLLQSLQNEQIDTRGVKQVDNIHSGVASILLSENDNRIIVIPGANSHCLPEDLDQNQALIRQGDLVLLQLEIPIQTIEHAVRLAKSYQKKVVLNPAPAAELSDELLQQVDYITPNRSELSLLTGQTIRDNQDLKEAMAALMDRGPKHVITTLGDEGAAFMDHERKLVKIPGYHVSVVDTTGAGDAFNAALAYSIAEGNSLREAVEFAVKVSALKVTKLGAQTGMPYLEEVQRFQQ